jgi:hypothetical protein
VETKGGPSDSSNSRRLVLTAAAGRRATSEEYEASIFKALEQYRAAAGQAQEARAAMSETRALVTDIDARMAKLAEGKFTLMKHSAASAHALYRRTLTIAGSLLLFCLGFAGVLGYGVAGEITRSHRQIRRSRP